MNTPHRIASPFTPAQQAVGLLAWLAIGWLPAIGGLFFAPGTWYAELEKPSWNPPAWIFGPVWTLLYLSLGVAAWLVWRRAGWRPARAALGLFLAQLALNAAWSPIFFGLQQPGWALVEIVLLLASILLMLAAFARHSLPAVLLLLPYLAWVSFATLLNFTLWQLNG